MLVPYTFTLMNWAAAAGLYHFLRRTSVKDLWLTRVPALDRG